MKKLLQY